MLVSLFRDSQTAQGFGGLIVSFSSLFSGILIRPGKFVGIICSPCHVVLGYSQCRCCLSTCGARRYSGKATFLVWDGLCFFYGRQLMINHTLFLSLGCRAFGALCIGWCRVITVSLFVVGPSDVQAWSFKCSFAFLLCISLWRAFSLAVWRRYDSYYSLPQLALLPVSRLHTRNPSMPRNSWRLDGNLLSWFFSRQHQMERALSCCSYPYYSCDYIYCFEYPELQIKLKTNECYACDHVETNGIVSFLDHSGVVPKPFLFCLSATF